MKTNVDFDIDTKDVKPHTMANNSTFLCNECLQQNLTNNPGDVYIWVAFIVVLAIVVCNMIPLIVMARNAQIRKHRFFRFLICLSFNAILTSPYLFTATIFRGITPTDDFSKLRAYFDCMLLQSYLHHGIIALERFFASGSNFDAYRTYFTTRRQILYLVLSYIMVAIFAALVLGINYDFDERKPLEVYGRKHDYILFVYGCTVLILLTIITVLTSVCTYRVVHAYLYWRKTVQPVRHNHLEDPSCNVQSVKSFRPPHPTGSEITEMPSTSTWVKPVTDGSTGIGKCAVQTLQLPSNRNKTVDLQSNSATQQTDNQREAERQDSHLGGRTVPLTASKSRRNVGNIKTFLLVLSVVLCFNVPYWLSRVLIYIHRSLVLEAVYRVSFIITAAQYAMNPVIYFFRIEMFRKALMCTNH
jgi:hypothetical protein